MGAARSLPLPGSAAACSGSGGAACAVGGSAPRSSCALPVRAAPATARAMQWQSWRSVGLWRSSTAGCAASRRSSGGGSGRSRGGTGDAGMGHEGGFIRNTRRARGGDDEGGGEGAGGRRGRSISKEQGGPQQWQGLQRRPRVAAAPNGSDGDPGDAPNLTALAALVYHGAASWNASRLCAAFNRLGKLCASVDETGARRSQWTELLHCTLDIMADAYLPLLPGLDDAKWCIIPLWACAKAGYRDGGLAAALLQQLGLDDGTRLHKAIGHDHANFWWSVSTAPEEARAAGLTEEMLCICADCLLRMAMGRVDIELQHCSNVLLGCARLGYTDPALLHALAAAAGQAASRMGEQHLSNTLYALGVLECKNPAYGPPLRRLTMEVQQRLQRQPYVFKPQDLSITLYALALLQPKDGHQWDTLLEQLAAAAGQAAGRMDEQGLANTIYALGVLQCKAPAFAPALQRLTVEVQQRLQRQPDALTPQGISSILYALALLRPEQGRQWDVGVGCMAPAYSPVISVLAAECKRRDFAGFSVQGLSLSAWALAKLGYRDQSLFAAAMEAAMQPDIWRSLTAQDWSSLWYALALVRHYPTVAFLESTSAASDLLRTEADAQSCTNLLWSLATLGVPYEPRLVGVLVERLGLLLAHKGEMKEQNLANSLWALAVMGPSVLSRHRRSVEGMLLEVRLRKDAEAAAVVEDNGAQPFRVEHLAELLQLWQVQQELAYADGCGELAGILAAGVGAGSHCAPFSDGQLAARWLGEEASGTISQLQRQVASALGRLQQRLGAEQRSQGIIRIVSVSSEQAVEGLWGRVDVVVELGGGRRVAVEVDGPLHFLANDPHTRTKDGSTQLRDRQLGRLFGADNVLSVPYWEWYELQGDGSREEGYLLRCLLGLRLEGPDN